MLMKDSRSLRPLGTRLEMEIRGAHVHCPWTCHEWLLHRSSMQQGELTVWHLVCMAGHLNQGFLVQIDS